MLIERNREKMLNALIYFSGNETVRNANLGC